MPSADLFLRLLEEKDLVSAEVLQAARREIQRTSLPPDAVRISLWLVQNQHITAAQAERLLAAAAEDSHVPWPPPPPLPRAFQAKSPEPQFPAGQTGKPDVRALQPKVPQPPQPAAAPADNLELAPLGEEGEGKRTTAKSEKPSSPVPQDTEPATPWASSPAESQGKKSPAPARLGGDLESLADTMRGPLDALVESEALQATEFDDPIVGPQLNPATPKKFKLRRFLKNLFKRNKSKVVRVKAADPKQVKLVLISWGVAVVILIGALISFYVFSPSSSTELRQKAEDALIAEDYSKAISLYDEFLKHYAATSDASDVRLSRGIAELRLAEKKATASGDWTPAFEIAQTQVKVLPKNHTDSDLMQKFSVALAKIGEGLAQQSQDHPDMKSVNRVQSIVNMLESDIPESNRPEKMLDEIKAILKHGKQEVEGRQELDQTVDAIGAAVKDRDVQAAYAAFRGLVQSYPELTDDVRLTDAMKRVSALQQKAVEPVRKLLAAVHAERPSGVLVAMPLAVQSVKGELAEGRGRRVFVVEQGTAYGLDAATGKTFWRRFVAQDPKLPAVTALPVAAPANDIVLCDPVHQELLRADGATGELRWRLAVGQPIVAEPVQVGTWLLLLTKDQRLLLIDVATGDSPRYFSLPQAVRMPPVVDAAHGLIFLAAEHSNLIALEMGQREGGQGDIGACRQVLHVGHEKGTIAAPPAVVGDFLLLPVNDTPSEATIRVFSISKGKQGGVLRAMQTIRVAGSIDTTPVAVGIGAAVVTAQGSLLAIDRNEAGNKLPFQVVASNPMVLKEKSTHYAISGGSTFWVADRQLTRYAVDVDEHRLAPQAISDLGMRFVRAPVIEGSTMFQVLQRSGMPGVTVSAFDVKKNEAVWQTWLAAPLVAEPALGSLSGKLTAVTASGGMFRAPPDGLKPLGKPWEPVLAIDSSRLTKPLCTLLPLPGEMFAMSSGAGTTQIAIYDPQEQDKLFRSLLAPHEMSAGPGAFAGGLLTACVNGQVFLLDPEARGDMAKPLEPVLKGVNIWEWRTPVAVDDKLAVLSDGDKRLTAIRISTDAEKTLTEAAAVVTQTGLVSPIAVLGKFVFVVDSTDSLLSFELPNLTAGKSHVLGAHCVWGPQRAGRLLLVATENRLFAIGEQQQVVWQSALAYGPLAGVPNLSGDEIYLTARSGMVWRISATEGKELGKIDAGCPLGTGPLVLGSRVIVGGHEGSLLEVKKP
ncbi:MAG: PQQ-binding-like beta-propeller repeat protein [Thermoguttaceae bacterium]